MFDLMIMASRYLFIFYIAFFLWQSIVFIIDEQGKHIGDPRQAVSIQRIIIVFMHITGFLILSYEPGAFAFDIPALALGGTGLVYILFANHFVEKIYKKSCPLIWNTMLFLLDTGLIILQRLSPALAQKQLVWMIIGTVIMLLLPFIFKIMPKFESMELLYILGSFFLIGITLILGNEEYGSKNWLTIGPIGFQPSEIVKFLFIFYLASVFRKRVKLKEILTTGILSGFLVLLLVMQKDLGGALIFFMTYMVMLYIATANARLFFGGMGVASVAAMLAYRLFSHVRVRVAAWQNPWSDIDGGGFQIAHSLFAISTWGFLGSGLTKGMPGKVPVAPKDFIFAAVCEEFGSLFGICIICLFMVIFFQGMLIAINCKRRYYSLLASGVISMFAFQTFLILGGVIKLIPLTGVTLPFMSYGGTSILVSILMIGLLQWVGSFYETRPWTGGDGNE